MKKIEYVKYLVHSELIKFLNMLKIKIFILKYVNSKKKEEKKLENIVKLLLDLMKIPSPSIIEIWIMIN